MAGTESKSMDPPDELRAPDKTRGEIVTVGGTEVGRFTFQPGWRWSECIRPVVGTDSCQAEHLGYPSYTIAPGHDAWVLRAEPFVGVEFKSAATFTKS